MPYIPINLADVDATTWEPLPTGSYPVTVERVEVRENRAGDGQYLNWELVVTEGDYEGRHLWLITSLKKTGLFRLKQILADFELLDEDEEFRLDYEGQELLDPDFVGLEGIAHVKQEEFNDEIRNKVTTLTPLSAKKKKGREDPERSSSGRRPAGIRRRVR